ncbi:tyrosine-type recombinase/integrase [Agromyces indicus]|uniref:Tyrosine-type recombinase/integrase n=1 Tax=Agromyces indicus TaxID=758919 RepID=A0ABU1FI92_9MICO|nr:tyrosine-type recombinase/integrase [Agromyces indicus]MDR5691057.1 tyrosine-type recombinase/integrase [Agromyces indicus]
MIYRRCGCRDTSGKVMGNACPSLKSNPRHGTWTYRLTRTDPDTGKRSFVTRGGFATKSEAKRAHDDASRVLRAGGTLRTREQTLGDFLASWLIDAERSLKPTTVREYRRHIDAEIVPALGRVPLSRLRKQHVADFIAQLTRAGRGATTVRRIHATLRSALSDALARDLIDTNPAVLPAKSKTLPNVATKRVSPWEPAEAARFLDVAASHRLGALFELAILTGLRRGELCGLRWADVDLAARKLTVRVQLVDVSGDVREQSIKTAAGSQRVLPLGDRAVAALIGWQIAQQAERDAAGVAWVDSGRVFTMSDGRQLRPAYASKLFETLQRDCGLPRQRFHDLRHLFASLALSSGEDMGVVSKLMGHSTSVITRDLYAHLVGDRARQVVSGVADLLSPSSSVLTRVLTRDETAPLSGSR